VQACDELDSVTRDPVLLLTMSKSGFWLTPE